MDLSKKQIAFLCEPLRRFNVLWGTTGSGKSFIANMRALYEIKTAPKNSLILLSGNTSESLYDNVVKPIMDIDGGRTLSYKTVQGNQRLICSNNGCQVVCTGANAENAQSRIQGKNVWLWYADEVVKQPKSFVEMAISRLRYEQSGQLVTRPCIWTLNPDHPAHFIKTSYIDRIKELKGKEWIFNFADNPTIKDPSAYKDDQSRLYSGVFADRMLNNIWGLPEGAVIPEFTPEAEADIVRENKLPGHYKLYAALDPGFADFTAYILGYYDFRAGLYVIDNELLIKESTTEQIASAIKDIEQQYKKPVFYRVSDTALQIIHDLAVLHKLFFSPTPKDNKEAQINYLRMMVQNRRIVINPRCTSLIRQLKTAVYKTNKQDFERSDIDGHYDLIDALIYWLRAVDIQDNPYPRLEVEDDDTKMIRRDKWAREDKTRNRELIQAFGG